MKTLRHSEITIFIKNTEKGSSFEALYSASIGTSDDTDLKKTISGKLVLDQPVVDKLTFLLNQALNQIKLEEDIK